MKLSKGHFGYWLTNDGDLAKVHAARSRRTLCNRSLQGFSLSENPVTCRLCLKVLGNDYGLDKKTGRDPKRKRRGLKTFKQPCQKCGRDCFGDAYVRYRKSDTSYKIVCQHCAIEHDRKVMTTEEFLDQWVRRDPQRLRARRA